MKYPSVFLVGQSVNKDEFYKQRLSVAGWVHNSEFVDNVLAGSYYAIKPLHIELCSTYSCNFNCPWCSCRKSRESFMPQKSSMTFAELQRVIDECKSIKCGIQWTGGEPLCNIETVNAIIYGSNLGVTQCLFTNGSLLDKRTGRTLLSTNLSFIRISLNSASPDVHQVFHGDIDSWLSTSVTKNVTDLCQEKARMDSGVQIGLSIVLNEKNIDDALTTIDFIAQTSIRFPGTIDFVIIRPVNGDITLIQTSLESVFWNKYRQFLSEKSVKNLMESGISVVFPSSYELPIMDSGKCLGCSCFSEVAPDGTMFLCSDKYGDKEYSIGNILTHGMKAWDLPQRFACIDKHSSCFNDGNCPHYSRGWYFNMLFAQIESYRKEGRLNTVQAWIKDLKRVVPDLGHSFFI